MFHVKFFPPFRSFLARIALVKEGGGEELFGKFTVEALVMLLDWAASGRGGGQPHISTMGAILLPQSQDFRYMD